MTSAWRRLAAAGELDERRVRLAISDLKALRLKDMRHTPLLERCWELRSNLTTYDASYVALAELLATVLVTADARLSNAPDARCEIEVLR